MRLTRRTTLRVLHGSAFVGFRFPPEVIVLAVCWYLLFGLSYRDVVELLAERGIEVDHVTIHRWVRRLALLRCSIARRAWPLTVRACGQMARASSANATARWRPHGSSAAIS